EKEAWFLSPLRSETQASFKVSKTKNRWYDHGTGIGGNVIDLVIQLMKCTVKEALSFLNNDLSSFSFHQQRISVSIENETLTIRRIKDISPPALLKYLEQRKIPVTKARTYCKEVWFQRKGKTYFAIGLQNEQGGWELRNEFFKASGSPKTYTYIQNNKTQLIILEGMFDLLSLATVESQLVQNSDIIILNSLAFINQIGLQISNYKRIILMLDNDPSGKKATQQLLKQFPQAIDQSFTYKNYKDLNEKLMHEKRAIT
ncbi:MAG: toprim domain-containing protein, partial [Flavobacteriaceae bacterium]|nr:toprim domain-containing protein [Flavobacteriaceae bacterium]